MVEVSTTAQLLLQHNPGYGECLSLSLGRQPLGILSQAERILWGVVLCGILLVF